jgi:4-hydroxybenzoate polyprenyltransferase
MRPRFHSLLDPLSSIRLRKILPGCLIFTNASLLGPTRVRGGTLILALVAILSGSALGMKLNVWTDRELDRAHKPELLAGLTRSASMTRALVVGECLALAASLVLLALLGDVARAGWLTLFVSLFNLYSFNVFVPHRREATRLKAYWWGNLLTAGGAYFTLWMGGLGAAPLIGFALTCAAAEYSMFLGECATDADEERRHGLRTLPSLVGRRRTVAIAFAASASVALAWTVRGRASVAALDRAGLLRIAGDWYVGFAVATCALLLARAQAVHRRALWDRSVDGCFWVMRLGLLVILATREMSA